MFHLKYVFWDCSLQELMLHQLVPQRSWAVRDPVQQWLLLFNIIYTRIYVYANDDRDAKNTLDAENLI